jgi:guanylate kinase
LYIVSAPSGAGKTSLVRELIRTLDDIEVSVSYTTRAPRPGERPGVDYHFVDLAAFQALLQQDLFLEYACVFDHWYGTSKPWVLERLQEGVDIVLEIDWQGARQVRSLWPDSVSIFILPPSRKVLEQRLRSRGQDSEEVIARRMLDATAEVSHYQEYDYLVVNEDFARTLSDLQRIIRARRLRRQAQAWKLRSLLADLLA